MHRFGTTVALATLLLSGCSDRAAPAPAPQVSTGEEALDVAGDRRTRVDLTREGVLAMGDYVFDLEAGEGDESRVARAVARLEQVRGEELELVVSGAPRRVSKQAAWPMLCLRRPLVYGEGALRVALRAGAPLYVAASDATHARVGPAPIAAFGRVLERDALALEDCADEVPSEGAAFVGQTAAGDQACLFADEDPVDESDGLPIPPGAPVETLDRQDEWARVRVAVRGGTIEGWLPTALIADAAPDEPDWTAAALRPDRCVFPGRRAASAAPRAWLERADDTVPLPSTERFEQTLRDADPRVRGCWDELSADQRPSRPSRVDVRIGVDGDGQVDLAAVVHSVNAPVALARCIAERVRRIRFPAPRTGVTLRRTYAFDPAPATDSGDDEAL